MAVRKSTGLLIAAADSGVDAVFNSGVLRLYSGAQPADADDAPSGTLLAEGALGADAFAAAAAHTSAGTKSSRKQLNASATLTGQSGAGAGTTAGWGRLSDSSDAGGSSSTEPRIDFAVVQSKPVSGSGIAWNAGTSKMRVTCTGHGFSTGNVVQVAGATTAALNARWVITVIDANTFDLDGSTNVSTSAAGRVFVGDAALDNPSIANGQQVTLGVLDLLLQ